MPIQANGYWPLAVILSYIHPKRNTLFYLPTTIFVRPNFHHNVRTLIVAGKQYPPRAIEALKNKGINVQVI